MREIKFRAWHPKKGMKSPEEMGNDQLTIMPDGRGFINVDSYSTEGSEFYPHMIPMQYTGLKDANGKEIYEGDVLMPTDPLMVKNRVVDFAEGSFVYTSVHPKKGKSYFILSLARASLFEVIGNIYENQELLEAS